MNKFIASLAFLICIVQFSPTSALVGGGVKVIYERGTAEWNKDKTDTKCVGKGTCKITVDVSVSAVRVGGTVGSGVIGVDENGNLCFQFPKWMVASDYWAEMFEDGKVHFDGDVILPDEIRNQLPGKPVKILKGQYDYVLDERNGVITCIPKFR